MTKHHQFAHCRFGRRQFALAAASVFLPWRPLRGQQEAASFSTDVKVVNVLATVRAKDGELVRSLTKDDFSLSENKRPQTIRYFSRESDLPLTLGLMVDTSASQRRVLDAERTACFHFLDRVLRPNQDRVFIMQFDSAVQLRQALTSSPKQLDEALTLVDSETLHQLQLQQGGGTLLYDAVVRAAKEVMKPLTGRKALIVLSDGVDFGSEETLTSAAEATQRADTLVYSILFSDAGAYGGFGGPDGKGVLERLSKETGGGFFEVSKKLGLEQIFDRIQEELRSQYNLGYVSDVPVRVSEFRSIELAARQKGLAVQARTKYWAQR
jgi:VWFA-related protein